MSTLALFTRPIPRQAFFAAAIGALYSFLLLPVIFWAGIAWLLLAVGLLFLRRLSYHAYSVWGLLWVVYRGVSNFRNGADSVTWVLDVGLPAVSVLLLVTSQYLHYCDLAEGIAET